MPKRLSEELELDPASRHDAWQETKSRSGRVVKPKVGASCPDNPRSNAHSNFHSPAFPFPTANSYIPQYIVQLQVFNDGTVALADESTPRGDAHDLPVLATTSAAFDDDDELSEGSEGSYGSTRTRTARAPPVPRSDTGRPSRRVPSRTPRVPAAPAVGAAYGGGGVFKQAAVEVLRSERRLMSTGEIAKLALTRGLVRCTGKTPEATMASALYTDIKRREDRSLFVRPREGLFGLREWVEDGVIRAPSGGMQYALTQHAQQQMQMHGQPMTHPMPMHVDVGEDRAGNSQDTGDRLMELLCAAEKINRAASSQEEADGHMAHITDEEHEEGTSAALRCVEDGHAEAVKAAEAEIFRLEAERGQNHPEVGKGYLTLVKMYMAECGMPAEVRHAAEMALGRVEEVMTGCQQQPTGMSVPEPAAVLISAATEMEEDIKEQPEEEDTKSSLAKIIAHHQVAPVSAPVAIPAPAPALTPIALEESRLGQWQSTATTTASGAPVVGPSATYLRKAVASAAAGMNNANVLTAPVTTLAPVSVDDDAENDADVEICLPAPQSLMRMQLGGPAAVAAI